MKKKLIGITSIVFIACMIFIANACSVSNANNKADLNKMKEAYKNYLLENTNTSKFENKSIDEIKANLNTKEIAGVKTYYYKDINYADDNNRAKWPAATHVTNANTLAIIAEKNGNAELKEISIGLIYYWVFNNFRNTNWWQNDLGVGANLSNCALFIFNELNDKGKAALLGKIHDASFTYHKGLTEHSGANLFDYAEVSIKSALLNNDLQEFQDVYDSITKEISTETSEGFQTDGSFFQHGKQIQIVSYGSSVVRLGKIIDLLSAGNVTLPNEKINIIQNYILKGLNYTIHKGYCDYSTLGRSYSKVDFTDIKSYNFKQLNYYLDVPNFDNKEGLKSFIDKATNKKSTFSGIQYFDVAKLITMNIDGLYMSFKGTDSDITNTECVNDENQLGLNLSYATNTCVMDDGKEYYNISPLWQYDYIPGTTSIALDPGKEDEQILKISQDHTLYNDSLYERYLPKDDGSNKYVYNGKKDENNNIACLMEKTTHHNENNLTVTCFASEDGMVLVGSGLDYTGEITGKGKFFTTDKTLHTTLEQCNYKGEYKLSDNKKTLTHGNAVYKILDNNIMNVEVKDRTGLWQRNNPSLEKPKEPATGKTLLAFIEHNKSKGAKYSYSIQPQSKQDKNFEIIDTGNDLIHAVKMPNGKIAVAFYADSSFDYDGNTYEGKCGEFKVF